MSFLGSIFNLDVLYWVLIVLYAFVCCPILITVVLLQKGKGSGFAGAFGVGGGSDAVFGPRATKSLPARITTVMATIFLVLAFALSLLEGRQNKGVAPEKISTTQAKEQKALSGLDSLGIGKAPKKPVTTPGNAGAPVAPATSQNNVPAPAAGAATAPTAAASTTPATSSATANSNSATGTAKPETKPEKSPAPSSN